MFYRRDGLGGSCTYPDRHMSHKCATSYGTIQLQSFLTTLLTEISSMLQFMVLIIKNYVDIL